MSASRKTENFNLPLYSADDATSWLVDFNGAMTELETHLTEMRNNLTTDGEDLDNLEKAVANLNKTTSQLTDSVIKVQESGKSNSSAITLLQTHDNEQDTRLSNLESETTNLESEISDLSNSVSADITALKEKNKSQDDSIAELKGSVRGLKWSKENAVPTGNFDIVPTATPTIKVGTVANISAEINQNDLFATLVLSGVFSGGGNVKSAGNVQFTIKNTTYPISDIIENTYSGNVYFTENGKIIPTKWHITKMENNLPIIVFDASVFESGSVTVHVYLQGLKNNI